MITRGSIFSGFTLLQCLGIAEDVQGIFGTFVFDSRLNIVSPPDNIKYIRAKKRFVKTD